MQVDREQRIRWAIGRARATHRTKRGWSQGHLAAMADVSQPVVAKVEKGDSAMESTLLKLAAAVGLPAGDYVAPPDEVVADVLGMTLDEFRAWRDEPTPAEPDTPAPTPAEATR